MNKQQQNVEALLGEALELLAKTDAKLGHQAQCERLYSTERACSCDKQENRAFLDRPEVRERLSATERVVRAARLEQLVT